MCTYTHVHTPTHLGTHMYRYRHVHTNTHVHTCAYSRTHTHHLYIIRIPFFNHQGHPLNRNSPEIIPNNGVPYSSRSFCPFAPIWPACRFTSSHHPSKNDSSTQCYHKLTSIFKTLPPFNFQWKTRCLPRESCLLEPQNRKFKIGRKGLSS